MADHYKNTPIQIYIKKFTTESFQTKIVMLFYISAQNIDCGTR